MPATFSVGSQTYSDLNDAITAAQSGTDKTIVVATDGSLSGSYTIPAGVTLLIPFDDANTLYTTSPDVDETVAKQIAYRTLTLDSNTSITVCGAISVGGKLFTSSNSHVCKPTGAYGQIQMNVGSQITVENGGELYAWGYITGSGNVRITSGATVYECFQVTDWRGGSATMKFGNPANVKKVFPFSQYYVQNIEAPLTIEYGGAEKAYIAAYGENIAIGFVGAGGMFELAEGATFTKTYDPATDRISFDISGNASLKGIKMKVIIATINSANYVLPINNNVNINIHSGVTTFSQDAALLPGVQVTIGYGAELNIQTGANLYVYDADEWSKNYVWGSGEDGISPVAYSPSGKGSRTISDVSINVNGTLNVNGSVYTTAGGADIHSSDSTGKFVQTVVPGTETKTYQCTQSGSSWKTKVTPVEIPITAAKLHNAGDSYTGTAGSKAGDTYVYANGKWALKGNEIAITFDPNGGAGSMEPMSVNPGVGNKLTDNTFTRENYTFTGWNTAKDGTGKTYADGEIVNFSADTTLYAQWTQNPVITFDANGGKGTMGTQTVKPNEATALTANSFTRADYDFTGWNTAADGTGKDYADKANITTNENVTLYAQWALHKYHIRWLNLDGAVLKEGRYTCEDNAGYDMWFEEDPEPTMPEDENYTYKFLNRWTPYNDAEGINGWGFNPHKDVDFTAVYNKFEKLTVTFDANGGIGTMDSVKIVNGKSGECYMLPECGFTREGYTFNGWLITGMVKMSEWAEEEELNDELWRAPELLALSNLTLKASWKHSDGWFTDDNGKQYYKDGELQKTGWTVIDGKTYYLDTETGYAATGIATLIPDGATEEARCVFDEEGVFQSDVTGVYSVGADTYWLNSGIIEEKAGLKRVVKEDGEVNYYYFGEDSKACKATAEKNQYLVEKTNGLALPGGINYTFGEDGVIAHFADTSISGIYFDESSSNYYYCIDGVIIANGLMLIDGSYYYARTSSGAFVCGRSYWITKTNGLLDAGIYTFDDAGKIIFPEKPKNGIVAENGSLYYYVDGVLTGAGLIQIGNDYYYVRTSTGEVVHGRSYWVTDTNDLLPAGPYTFDTDGKMINPPVVDPNPDPDPTPDVKNGIVAENGSLYYYENGVLTGAGLIQLNGDYYYVKTSNCEVVHGRSYWITVTNGLLPTGQYMFADNGKLIR
ncbi:InlB B-repeat-containing protein [Dysosmobacter sp.]|uniref:InlB B-repeat-containing protein n=1 Tax=Dysosmobacter sp. TaxID=2591382 RepID=UPI003AB57B42